MAKECRVARTTHNNEAISARILSSGHLSASGVVIPVDSMILSRRSHLEETPSGMDDVLFTFFSSPFEHALSDATVRELFERVRSDD